MEWKWGEHQKKKIVVDNAVQVLIPFWEHWEFADVKKEKEFSSTWKKNVRGSYSESIEILLVLWYFKRE